MPTETIPTASAVNAETSATLLLPVGHSVGALYRISGPSAPHQVRRGATFHELSDDQFAVWSAAHGTPDTIEDGRAWNRRAVETDARVAGGAGLVDQLLGLGLLAEVTPGTEQALEFARSHRLVPLMLGLGNSSDEPDMFGIGFLHQPVMQVSHPVYDLWQWSTMDDTLWATCENAADVARRAGATEPDSIDPAALLTGFLPTLHALLLPHAAYLDTYFRLAWPDGTAARGGTRAAGDD